MGPHLLYDSFLEYLLFGFFGEEGSRSFSHSQVQSRYCHPLRNKIGFGGSLHHQILWSGHKIGCLALEASGSSGDIIIMWNEPAFELLEVIKGLFSYSYFPCYQYTFWLDGKK